MDLQETFLNTKEVTKQSAFISIPTCVCEEEVGRHWGTYGGIILFAAVPWGPPTQPAGCGCISWKDIERKTSASHSYRGYTSKCSQTPRETWLYASVGLCGSHCVAWGAAATAAAATATELSQKGSRNYLFIRQMVHYTGSLKDRGGLHRRFPVPLLHDFMRSGGEVVSLHIDRCQIELWSVRQGFCSVLIGGQQNDEYLFDASWVPWMLCLCLGTQVVPNKDWFNCMFRFFFSYTYTK
jgi:hypothetical protein